MALTERIPRLSNPAVASYDFIEFAQQQGYAKLYIVDDTSNNTLLLTSTIMRGRDGFFVQNKGDTFSKDADLIVTKPINTGTLVYFNMPLSLDQQTGGYSGTITFAIKKVSGATTTTLGSGTADYSSPSGNTIFNYILFAKATIPVTHFAIGDKIRVTISATLSSPPGTYTHRFGTDPAGRTGPTLFVANTATALGTNNFVNGADSFILFPVKLDLS